MIHVEIAPTGVARVLVTGDSPLDQDLCLMVWPYVREHIDRIDRRLRREAPGLLERLKPTAGSGAA
jgi:hypothetical protein